MRPTVPPDIIIPPAPVDEGEKTPAENPFAKMIENAVARAMAPVADRIIAAINGVGHRLTVLELSQKANEASVRALRDDVDALKAWRRDTERCGPPEEAA